MNTFDEYKGSVVLVVNHDLYDNPKAPKATATNIVPDTFLLGNNLYRLSEVILFQLDVISQLGRFFAATV